jgi:NAD(P)-dependent dehydrogenase (short-subunit alcohol dehydrogenase family)
MRLANKTALITGGNSGIGLATAKLFAAEGARVVITGRNKQTLEAAASKLDIVFANAGIAGGTPLGSATLETFEKVISTNITAVFFTVQAAVPHLNDGASIILNGSVISVLGNPGYSAYAASKAGVRAMARVMASELSPRNIRVNVVSPGAIRTPIWGPALATPEAEKAFEKRIGASTPLGRIGEPDHISKTVLFLASDDSAHVQGQELFVDGGSTASPAGAPIYRG